MVIQYRSLGAPGAGDTERDDTWKEDLGLVVGQEGVGGRDQEEPGRGEVTDDEM